MNERKSVSNDRQETSETSEASSEPMIEDLYGITRDLVKRLHKEEIFYIRDINKASFKLPDHILASAKLRKYETRVDIPRANLELLELNKYLSGFGELILAGSYRRGKSDMKDLDFILISDYADTGSMIKSLPKDVYLPVLKGDRKVMLYAVRRDKNKKLSSIRIDLVVVPTLSRAVALVHFTGSAKNNIRLRIAAKRRGLLLNEKYILNLETGETIYPKTEEEVFQIVGVEYQKPEDRE